jgi:5-methylcytosine-specific restriction protein B
MDQELLIEKWNQYKTLFFDDSSRYEEKYKWDVLQQVSEKWDWNAPDKGKMFKEAFEVKGSNNLWTSVNYYPITMASWFFNDFPEETKSAFDKLFDENIDLLTRLNAFKNYFDNQLNVLKRKYPDTKLNYHSQDIRSMSLYLFINNPQKYALFKYSFVKSFSEIFGTKKIKRGQHQNYINYLDIINEIKIIVSKDQEFISEYLESNTNQQLFADQSLHLLIQDFMYCTTQYNDKEKKQYWLYSPGEQARKWDDFFNEGIVALGWDDLQDLNSYENREEITKDLIKAYGGSENKPNDTSANDDFFIKMKVGDIIIAKKGLQVLLGYGEVTSEYYFDDNVDEYKHRRKINWKKNGNWHLENDSLVLKTLTDVTNYKSPLDANDSYPKYLLDIINGKKSNNRNENSPMIDLIQYKKQIILQGPPGTGKTRLAKDIALEMLSLSDVNELQENKQFKLIQFHPSYTYEDFVQGIVAKPNPDGDGILYEAENKTLGLFAKEALNNFLASKGKPIINSEFQFRFNILIDKINEEINSGKTFKFGEKSTAEIISVGNEYLIYSFPERKEIRYKLLFSDIEKVYGNREVIKIPIDLRDKEKEFDLLMKGKYPYYFMILRLLEKIELPENFNLQNTDVKEKPFILVIDEINRANLSSVLGELIYALEYRGENVESMYKVGESNQLILPPNLYIIGTMNTADRSVGHIDYAIRRRFAFVDVLPKNLESKLESDFKVEIFAKVASLFIENYDSSIDYSDENVVMKKSEYMTADFDPKDVWLGHSYFIQHYEKNEKGEDIKEKPVDFIFRIKYEIKPILEEYIKDGILKESARSVINSL